VGNIEPDSPALPVKSLVRHSINDRGAVGLGCAYDAPPEQPGGSPPIALAL